MFFIAAVLLFIFFFMIYVYCGIRLTEGIENQYALVCFYLAYTLFGFVIINIIMLAYFWEELSNKQGPPGVRGQMGDNGDQGIDGECSDTEAVALVKKEIKEHIVNIVSMKYTDIGNNPELIYDKSTSRLKNNYIDEKVNKMVNSKQFKILSSLNYESQYGKTLNQIKIYLFSLWYEWINLILNSEYYLSSSDTNNNDNNDNNNDNNKNNNNKNNNKNNDDEEPNNQRNINNSFGYVFFTKNYVSLKNMHELKEELEKYDAWNWGMPERFRRLTVKKCSTVLTNNNLLSDLSEKLSEDISSYKDNIGWVGYPIKNGQKYSIFSYLGYVPVGLMVNIYYGYKMLFVHEGQDDNNLNRYKIWSLEDYIENNSKLALTLKKTASGKILCEFKENSNDANQYFRIDTSLSNDGKFGIMPINVRRQADESYYVNINNKNDTEIESQVLNLIKNIKEKINEPDLNYFQVKRNSLRNNVNNNSGNNSGNNSSNNSGNNLDNNLNNNNLGNNLNNNSSNDLPLTESELKMEIGKYLSLMVFVEVFNLISYDVIKTEINIKPKYKSIIRNSKNENYKIELDNELEKEFEKLSKYLTQNGQDNLKKEYDNFILESQNIKKSILSFSISKRSFGFSDLDNKLLFYSQPFNGVDFNIHKENINMGIDSRESRNVQKDQQRLIDGKKDFNIIFNSPHKIRNIKDETYKGDTLDKQSRKNKLKIKKDINI